MLLLVVVDTSLTSLGIGMIFPVFQALIDPSYNSPLLQQAVPALLQFAPETRLLLVATATVLLFGLKAAITMLTSISTNAFLQDLRFYWVNQIGEHYLYGPQRVVSGKKPGELLNNWFNETLSATRFFQSCISYFSSTMLVLALVVIGLVINWQAMLGMIIAASIVAALGRRKLFRGSALLSKTKVALNQSVTAAMIENLTHIRDLKILQAEELRLRSLNENCRLLAKAILKGTIFSEIPRVSGEFLAVLALMSFIVISVKLLNQPPTDILPLMAFFFIAFYRLISAGSMATAARIKALNEMHSVTVISQLLAQSRERENETEGEPLNRLNTDIELHGVNFSYDAKHPILADINAKFPHGKTTLLLGPSGAGKSTLLDLLMRLETPESGSITAMGLQASKYRLSDWRRQFGYVSQEAALFNGDILANLRLANPDASPAEIEHACRLAGAEDFIRDLPHGYATLVGDRGYSLSGGQRKRIAIARALIRKPSVLILDEATTSFEQSLEWSMLRALRAAMPDMTIIQVTHRLTMKEGADWVIALQGGKIIAEGDWISVQSRFSSLFQITNPQPR
ncbi:ABC transporter ATP-binding protein [Ferrovibrio sp.]|uniref:ABC transporter ATP-binding protein n=1 Tax=Ferrovibrio sp. TaxID=1917215 RepID=UPI00391CA064